DVFAGKKSAQIREILISESAWEEMTCLFAPSLAQLFVHMISFPLMGLTPPLFDLPWYENLSEIFGHLVWFWSIEIIRRDLRNRITHEPDPEIPLGSNR
ncbi:DUF1440 domain-containing protein, partial [Escherichia coli]